jgi:TetR/AcrR family transcriptional regulator
MARPTSRRRTLAPGARRIESAARRLFAARGFAGTSMADIAAAAGVSKATVFHHYRTKRGLYEALVSEAVTGFREQLIPLLDPVHDLRGSLQEFAAAHVARLTGMQATTRLIAREMLSGSSAATGLFAEGEMGRNFALLVDALRRGQSRGTVRSDVDPGLAVFMLLAANWFLVQNAARLQRHPDLAVINSTDAYAAELARLLAHGLSPTVPEDSP